MFFELTKSVIEELIFGMENQDGNYFFDSENSCIVPEDGLEEEEVDENENLYSLPDWRSSDGFQIMEEFAEALHADKVKAELFAALSNRRGVFKAFKNVLSKYPEIEKSYFSFKEKKMRSVVIEWYNSLRESWGLEKLNQDFEDYDDLVFEDFEFEPYNHKKDSDCILTEAKKIAEELKTSFEGEKGLAMSFLWLRNFDFENPTELTGLVCRSASGDFAGTLLFSHFPSFAKNVVALTSVFVNQNFRSLGLARELFSRGISYLKSQGIQDFIIADSLPDFLEPLVTRCGFEKKGSYYILELADNSHVEA
ncbi:MAG: GNAT family N-acetyltransferase [Treponema sp.]|nr:GNAT family N-acetyltransferase [Treponema sp.]